jgi:hypothetical protein
MFALFRCVFPARIAHPSSEPLTDEERRIYRRWDIGSPLLCLPLATVFGLAWYLALTRLGGLFPHESPDTVFVAQPAPVFWGVPAIFLGMLTSAIPLDLCHRAVFRDRYRRFERYCNERVGFDSNRVFIVFAVIILAGSAVFFLAGVTSFARFTDAGNKGHTLCPTTWRRVPPRRGLRPLRRQSFVT